jgi:hypothetical protein
LASRHDASDLCGRFRRELLAWNRALRLQDEARYDPAGDEDPRVEELLRVMADARARERNAGRASAWLVVGYRTRED